MIDIRSPCCLIRGQAQCTLLMTAVRVKVAIKRKDTAFLSKGILIFFDDIVVIDEMNCFIQDLSIKGKVVLDE